MTFVKTQNSKCRSTVQIYDKDAHHLFPAQQAVREKLAGTQCNDSFTLQRYTKLFNGQAGHQRQ